MMSSDLLIFFSARKLWKEYYADVDAVVFMVDSNDRARFAESKMELDVLFWNQLITQFNDPRIPSHSLFLTKN